MEEKKIVKRIRLLTAFFIVALIGSGITAFPVETELKLVCSILNIDQSVSPSVYDGFQHWIALVNQGVVETNKHFSFMAYGYDWLAFAHIVIAVAFIGVYRHPIRNIWVVHFAMIACIGVLPLAFICGHVRGIPIFWQLIDSSFGVFGLIPLYLLHYYIKRLAKNTNYVAPKY